MASYNKATGGVSAFPRLIFFLFFVFVAQHEI